MNENRLSIIIPAYKTEYLDKVFECIIKQTNKNFNLYVFDDASPYPIKDSFDKYFINCSNAFYKRFKDNLGSKDLAAHWNRCVENSGNEEWVWLFSDDDLLSNNCVEQIYLALENSKAKIEDVMHFNFCQINENDVVTETKPQYPQYLTAADYFCLLHTHEIDTRMPEFIFRREKLKNIGGFISFDLAWRSDNATVTAMTYPGTIYTFPLGIISWRLSRKNVTGINKDEVGLERKRLAEIAYLNWNYHFFKDRNESDGMTKTQLYKTYFAYSRPRWVYKMHFDDVIELIYKFDAITTSFDKVYFILLWILENFRLTQKRYWLKKMIDLFTTKS